MPFLDTLLGALLGAFFGFLSGLYWDRRERGGIKKSILAAMRTEIRLNQKRLDMVGGFNTIPMLLGSWESLLVSGLITSIDDKEILKDIILGYRYGKAYNEMPSRMPSNDPVVAGTFETLRTYMTNVLATLDNALSKKLTIQALESPER